MLILHEIIETQDVLCCGLALLEMRHRVFEIKTQSHMKRTQEIQRSQSFHNVCLAKCVGDTS